MNPYTYVPVILPLDKVNSVRPVDNALVKNVVHRMGLQFRPYRYFTNYHP